jgi:hypothetical protein
VATFVNPDCKTWTQKSLLKSYDHLLNFPKDNPDILKHISYGQKDRDNIDAFNACMLYTLCKKYGIETHWKMTPEQMVLLIQKLDSKRMAMGSSFLIYFGGYKLDTKINEYFNYTQLYLY